MLKQCLSLGISWFLWYVHGVQGLTFTLFYEWTYLAFLLVTIDPRPQNVVYQNDFNGKLDPEQTKILEYLTFEHLHHHICSLDNCHHSRIRWNMDLYISRSFSTLFDMYWDMLPSWIILQKYSCDYILAKYIHWNNWIDLILCDYRID